MNSSANHIYTLFLVEILMKDIQKILPDCHFIFIFFSRLNDEIEKFNEILNPTQTEKKVRDQVTKRIKLMLLDTRIWPDARIEMFGSTFTGLYLANSDIDFNVQSVSDLSPLKTLQIKLLATDIAEPNSVLLVERARYPLISFIDRESQIPIDINVSNKSIQLSSIWIKNHIKKYPVLPKLFFVLKQFLSQEDLNDVRSGMTFFIDI